MTKYIIKRLIGMIPTLFIIVTLSFFIVRIAPGGPFDGERALPEAVKRNIEAKYHMDEPLLMQYGRYMFDVVRGDLGPSYKYKDYDVNTLIGVSLPNSIVLGSFAMVVALIFGISLGTLAAVKQNTILDYFPMILASFGLSIPLFVFAPLLQQVPHDRMVHEQQRPAAYCGSADHCAELRLLCRHSPSDEVQHGRDA